MTDVAEAWVLRNLSFGEVAAILASRRRKLDPHIYIWTEAWSDWKNLEDPEAKIFLTPRRESQRPPALPLVPFLAESSEEVTKAPTSVSGPRPVPVSAKPAPQVSPITQTASQKTDTKKKKSLELKDLKQFGPRLRKREITASQFSMDDLASQLEDQDPQNLEPQTLEPIPEPQVKKPKAPSGDEGKGNRKYTRFPVNLPVRVINNRLQTHSITRDISEGGLRLADPLPDEFAGYCEVIISPADRAPFELLCSLVEDQNDGKFHLEFVDNVALPEFIAWLRRQRWAAA